MRPVALVIHRSELELSVLTRQRITEPQLRVGRPVQQTVGATVVRAGIDLTLLVLPQGLRIRGRNALQLRLFGDGSDTLACLLQRQPVRLAMLA